MASQAAAAVVQPWAGAGRIDQPDDVQRVLAAVTAAGTGRANLADVRRPVGRASEADASHHGVDLAVHPLLARLLPWPGGLRRGSTVAVSSGRSLLLALLSAATASGGYAAVIGLPDLGLVAAAEHHVALDRLALIPDPGPQWSTVAATLLDGVAMVAVNTPGPVSPATARALSARARSRGAILVPTTAWSGADLTLATTARRFHGLGNGRGRIRHQEITVEATGRGAAARRRTLTVSMPLPPVDQRPTPMHQLAAAGEEKADRSA